MISLPRLACVAAACPYAPTPQVEFLQQLCGRDAWRVAIASMLLCRTRRSQAEPALRKLLAKWPDAASLARSDTKELLSLLAPLGLQYNRSRQLQRMSSMWHSEAWRDLRDLPGVGVYVADAVGLFVFGCTELESNDEALKKYVETIRP